MNGTPPIKGASLPDGDHVLRYVPPRHVEDGVVNGAGFFTRPNEDAPSVNWVEWFFGSLEEQVAGIRAVARLEYRRNGRLARLNVGNTIRYVRETHPEGLTLRFIHDPIDADSEFPEDPSHSLILGRAYSRHPEADLVKDLIAHCVRATPFSGTSLRGEAATGR
jgi:hypothetical protein